VTETKERTGGLQLVMLFTMAASTFQLFTFAVLAVDIIDDIPMTRTTLGLLGSLNTLVGAISAPWLGRLTDRIGPVRATVATLAVSGLGLGLMALSTNLVVLALSAAIGGIVQGSGNPVTNSLIAERVAPDRRGVITGVKQSGVQLAIFAAGISLPRLAGNIGWQGAVGGYGLVFLVGAGVAAIVLGRSPSSSTQPAPSMVSPAEAPEKTQREDDASTAPSTAESTATSGLPSIIYALALYALFAGTAAGAIGRFFPLWANEELGLSTVTAGDIVSLGGLIGIGARVWAGRLTQRPSRQIPALAILAAVGACYAAIVLLTEQIGAWVLWPGAAFNAVGIGAWNAVAMLAIITVVPRRIAGRASGIVMAGFLGGLSISGPLAGAAADRYGTYQPVWFASLLLMLAAFAVMTTVMVLGNRSPDGQAQSRSVADSDAPASASGSGSRASGSD
jgi:sugar phosphate permease